MESVNLKKNWDAELVSVQNDVIKVRYFFQSCVREAVAADLKLSHVSVERREESLEVFESGALLTVGRQDVDQLAAKVVQQPRVGNVLRYEPEIKQFWIYENTKNNTLVHFKYFNTFSDDLLILFTISNLLKDVRCRSTTVISFVILFYDMSIITDSILLHHSFTDWNLLLKIKEWQNFLLPT